ncbi:hypothetical protein TEA_028353 [Camellia sinensis var. sinensis]|uniref:ABC-2 type transporter transmembrane domain-containing protein n=1 Tax=Camellia sinensis var. sinensis TaxID=542762 RepID=A0A4S4DP50_CAMSN|nr:hypothetical protein TEA_028353 [Camellia sinensis var. sinensis]
MTVRETLDFSARCQGIGSRVEIMIEVSRREKQSRIVPDPDVDIYMKILGLDICAYILIGDAMRRGISGGQKKRLTTEGKIVYHGPCSHVLEFFEDCGFRCSKRKGVADFLQEVISKKDQAQYWHQTEQSCNYISADMFSKKFKESPFGIHSSLRARELLLMRRNSFMHVFKSTQLSLTVGRLAVFYKQRDLYFYSAWAYAIPATILKAPISLFSALIWTSLTYYVVGYSLEAGRLRSWFPLVCDTQPLPCEQFAIDYFCLMTHLSLILSLLRALWFFGL